MKQVHFDRVALYAEIATICQITEDRIVLGSNEFSTIQTIGRVAGSREESKNRCLYYTLVDPMVPSCSIEVYAYKGMSNDQCDSVQLNELMYTAGRLRNIDGKLSIQSFCIRPLECPEEYDAFRMEAFLAKDYHIKTSRPRTSTERVMSPSLHSPSTPQSNDKQSRVRLSSTLLTSESEPPLKKKNVETKESDVVATSTANKDEAVEKDSFDEDIFE